MKPMGRRALYSIAAIFAAAVMHGCGDDGPAGPTNELTGTWAYSATNVSGGGVSCGLSGTTLTLQQAGSTFTGSYTGGTVTCTGPGGTFSDDVGAGIVANGSIAGSNVSFDFDSSDHRHTGTLSGNSISGTVTIRLDLGSPLGVVTLTGNFAAVRR